ncbi:MAG TPA: hypothetical protein VFU16_00845 [Solirubrobacterales bacterium]|nr:hypothetical protein [Solirubrobacterales bacterium]
MPFLFFAGVALLGAAVQLHRERPDDRARALEILLVWRSGSSASSALASATASCSQP